MEGGGYAARERRTDTVVVDSVDDTLAVYHGDDTVILVELN